jgi:Fur family ferric uptake transcriptional regulator
MNPLSGDPQPTVPRMTRQRAAVLTEIGDSAEFRSAQEWHERLRHAGSPIGLATVYRTLQSLAEAGDVDCVRNEAGESLYRRCSNTTRHHHHLRCRGCGVAVEIEGAGVEAWAESIAARYGYSRIAHTVELTGLCQECTAKES